MSQKIRKFCCVLTAIALTCCMLSSCTSIGNLAELNKWLNDSGNGCISSRTIAGVTVTVKYLPTAYALLKGDGLSNSAREHADSMLSACKNSVAFLMTVGPSSKTESEDVSSVMYQGVSNYGEYSDRVVETNFFMGEHIRLYGEDKVYEPKMALAENLYEISDQNSFLVVFARDSAKEFLVDRGYTFVYDDPFYNLGKVQFSFDTKDLRSAEKLRIKWE